MTLRAAFEDQAVSCERLDSPFMDHLLRILSKTGDQTPNWAKRWLSIQATLVPLAIRYHCVLPVGFMLWFSQVNRMR